MTVPARTAREVFRTFLLGSAPPDDVGMLRDLGLAAYACTVVPAGHPLRSALRADLVRQSARHAVIVGELAPLLHAWHRAGIEALLFKGLHLSAFVYPVPGSRFHGDVDLLVRPADVERAVAVAARLGWELTSGAVRANGHNAATLRQRGGAAQVDLHRWVVHGPARGNRSARRITAAIWDASVAASLGGAPVCLPQPVDALVVGLMVQRAWCDRWALKSHDAIDFRLLQARAGVSREALLLRAMELRCSRTVELFLARCDPDRDVLELAPPTAFTRASLELRIFGESGLLPDVRWLPWRVARAGTRMLLVLPHVLAAFVALRHNRAPHAMLQAVEPRAASSSAMDAYSSSLAVDRVVRVLRWMRPALSEHETGCLLRGLSMYRVLRRQRRQVTFVSGVRREGDALQAHAWVELDGQEYPYRSGAQSSSRYRESYRHPAVPLRTAYPAPLESTGR